MGVEGLLVLGDAGFQAGSPYLRLSAVDVRLVSDVLPQGLLVLLVDHRHWLTVHVVRLLLLHLLVVRLYRLSSALEGALAAGALAFLTTATVLPRGRVLAPGLLCEHLFVLGQHVLL